PLLHHLPQCFDLAGQRTVPAREGEQIQKQPDPDRAERGEQVRHSRPLPTTTPKPAGVRLRPHRAGSGYVAAATTARRTGKGTRRYRPAASRPSLAPCAQPWGESPATSAQQHTG